MKKMTKREKWAIVKAILEQSNHPQVDIVKEFADREVELLSKKNSTEKKPTAKQVANEGLKTAIVEVLFADPNRLFTVSELMKEVPVLSADPEMTNQRVSALLRQMYDKDNMENPAFPVKRSEEKRKAYFQANPSYEG